MDSSTTTDSSLSLIDSRMIAGMRLVLAFSALLIIYLDPSEPDRLVAATYSALILYTLYCALLYGYSGRKTKFFETIDAWSHWLDVAWYTPIIALSSGTSSIFFFFLFLPILVASFQWGFDSGLRTVFVSTALFIVVGYATSPAAPHFELNRFLLRPIYLSVIGYMIAYWGGSETTLRRRLRLLKEVTQLSNPRFGVDRTIGVMMEKLRAFFDADSCVLIMADFGLDQYHLRRCSRINPESGVKAELLAPELARKMLAISKNLSAIYSRPHPSLDRWRKAAHRKRPSESEAISEELANTFDAVSLLTVPLFHHKKFAGRVYLISRRRNSFKYTDPEFVTQVFENVIPVIDNVRLVDRLASDAAEQERQRIARDIHDSVIQPYIGIQYGLAAVKGKLSAGNDDVTAHVGRLIEMTERGIADLKRYVTGLRAAGEPGDGLLEAVKRYAIRFSEATGLAVEVEVGSEIKLNDRLAAEVFQMVAEGLSNVRRHTDSRMACIKLDCIDGRLKLTIQNEVANGLVPSHFAPRSLTDRAAALGGHVEVYPLTQAGTRVVVEIPL